MSKTLKVSLFLFFIAVIAFGGVWYYFNYQYQPKGTAVNEENNQKVKNISLTEKYTNLYNNNKFDELIKELEGKTDIDSLIMLANTYLQKGSLEFKEEEYSKKALLVADRILELNPNSSQAYYIFGYANEITQNYDEAIKNYEKVLMMKGLKESEIFARIGHVYDLSGNIKKAEEYYQKALVISKDNNFAKENMARVYFRNEKYQKALKLFQEVFNKEKNNRVRAESAVMISNIYLTDKFFDLEKAKEYSKLAIGYDDSLPMGYIIDAEISFKKIKLDKKNIDFVKEVNNIITQLNKAVLINSNQTVAYWKLAKISYYLDNKKEASDYYIKALEVIDKDIVLMDSQKKSLKEIIKIEIKDKGFELPIKISSLEKNIYSIVSFITSPEDVKANKYKPKLTKGCKYIPKESKLPWGKTLGRFNLFWIKLIVLFFLVLLFLVNLGFLYNLL